MIWITKEGIPMEFEEMEEDHIRKCIAMLERQVEELYSLKDTLSFPDMTVDIKFDLQQIDTDILRKELYIKNFIKELGKRGVLS